MYWIIHESSSHFDFTLDKSSRTKTNRWIRSVLHGWLLPVVRHNKMLICQQLPSCVTWKGACSLRVCEQRSVNRIWQIPHAFCLYQRFRMTCYSPHALNLGVKAKDNNFSHVAYTHSFPWFFWISKCKWKSVHLLQELNISLGHATLAVIFKRRNFNDSQTLWLKNG